MIEDTLFIVSKVFWLFARPNTFALFLACLGGLALIFRRRWGRWPLVLGLGWFVAVLLTPMPAWITLPLEDRFARPEAVGRVDGVIILGGAVEQLLTERRGIPALNGAAERMIDSQAGDALVSLPGAPFLHQYAMPNFFFHVTSAYAILRSHHVALGKADFDGWHAY